MSVHNLQRCCEVCMGLFLTALVTFLLVLGPSGTVCALLLEETTHSGDGHRNYGWSVDMDGNYAIVGQPGLGYRGGGGGYIGKIFIYKRQQFGHVVDWSLEFTFEAPSGDTDEFFGYAVAIDGDYAAVTAPRANNHRGALYIFHRHQNGTDNWGLNRTRPAPNEVTPNAWFGSSVDIDGDWLIVGCSEYDGEKENQGAAYIYNRRPRRERPERTWLLKKKLYDPKPMENALFGSSVGISTESESAVVGAMNRNHSRGGVYIFQRIYGGPDAWGAKYRNPNPYGEPYDNFGSSVSIDGYWVAVGAKGEDHRKGAVYIYRSARNVLWRKETRLVPSVSAASFGHDVDIRRVLQDGKLRRIYVAVGETDNHFPGETENCGSISIHTRVIGGTNIWSFVSRTFPSDRVDLMRFGHSLALDGGDVVIAATPHQIWNNGRVYCYSGVTDH